MTIQAGDPYPELFRVGRRTLPLPNLEGARYPYNLASDIRTVTVILITS